MKLGYIGLGKMGYNMVVRLIEKKHEVLAFDINEESRARARTAGARTQNSIVSLVGALDAPRVIWVMVPHTVFGEVLKEILPLLNKEDTIIDGGNSFYKDSIRRAQMINAKKINFLDVGVSGGPGGALNGACMMIGGKEETFESLKSLFVDLTVPEGYAYVGGHGAGHFVKMVHNGIEYGMMQSIAEGFSVMEHSRFNLNLTQIANIYNHGSVVESRLLEWLKLGYVQQGEELKGVSGTVAHTGEGGWTVEAAHELNIPAPIIEGSLQFRKDSKKNPSYAGKILSTLRNQFGGHETEEQNE